MRSPAEAGFCYGEMMSGQSTILWGLAANMAGVVLAFFFGYPQPSHSEGVQGLHGFLRLVPVAHALPLPPQPFSQVTPWTGHLRIVTKLPSLVWS